MTTECNCDCRIDGRFCGCSSETSHCSSSEFTLDLCDDVSAAVNVSQFRNYAFLEKISKKSTKGILLVWFYKQVFLLFSCSSRNGVDAVVINYSTESCDRMCTSTARCYAECYI